MASRKSDNKNQKATTSTSTRIMQVVFIILSIMIVLSMILSATVTY